MQTETEYLTTTQQVTRRRFFSYVGWGSFASFWLGASMATIRFFFPRVLYEPSQRFDAGKPEDYQVGEVSTRLQQEQRVWITGPRDQPPFFLPWPRA